MTSPGSGQQPARWPAACRPGRGTESATAGRVVRCHPEVGACRGRAVHEQVDRLVVGDGFRGGYAHLVGDAERWNHDHVLAAQPERPPAGQQEPDVRTGRAQPLHEIADRGHEVFAVVEHQQRGAVGNVVGERLDLPRTVGPLEAQCLGDGEAEQFGLRRRPRAAPPNTRRGSCAAPPRRTARRPESSQPRPVPRA